MKNMVYFELRKIFVRKFNLIAMFAGYLLILFCVFYLIKNYSFYDKDTESHVKGINAFQMSKEKNNAMTDYLTEDYLTHLTKSIQAKNIQLDTDEGYIEAISPIKDILWVLCNNYTDARESVVDWNKINEISTKGGINFYKRRIEKATEFLNMDFSYGNYSNKEKSFWLSMEQKVVTPFKWGDKAAMDIVWDAIQIAFYFMFVIVLCISPVFASEYESGAAALLLTTKNGKNQLIYAKIIAVVLFSVLYMVLGTGLGIVIIGVVVGIHGAELPVQLWGTVIPYNWSVGMACVVSFAVILLVTLTVALFTAFLSSNIKSSMVVLIIGYVLLIAPALFPMSKESGLWNHINYLFPVRVASVKDMIKTFNSYQFGTAIISYLGMAVVVYLIISIISFWRIKSGFAKHQVEN